MLNKDTVWPCVNLLLEDLYFLVKMEDYNDLHIDSFTVVVNQPYLYNLNFHFSNHIYQNRDHEDL